MQHRRVIKFGNLIKAFNGIDHFREFFWLLGFLNKRVTIGLLLLFSSGSLFSAARPDSHSGTSICFCSGWDQHAIPPGDENLSGGALPMTVSH